jgi:tRNA threonylcarbamoyladenosine biosynthesis protein TsaB
MKALLSHDINMYIREIVLKRKDIKICVMERRETRHILAIDTSMTGCGVCVLDTDSGVFATRHHDQAFGQAEHLIPLVKDCAHDAGVKFSQLDLIACTIGPGSFTGLRTGLTAAKSLSLALECPVYGVNSFLALSHTALKNNDLSTFSQVASVIDTRRSDFFVLPCDVDGKGLAEPSIMTVDEVVAYNAAHDDVFWVGDFGDLDLNGQSVSKPDPIVIAHYAAQHYDPKETHTLEPLYLRGADIGVSKKPVRKLGA